MILCLVSFLVQYDIVLTFFSMQYDIMFDFVSSVVLYCVWFRFFV